MVLVLLAVQVAAGLLLKQVALALRGKVQMAARVLTWILPVHLLKQVAVAVEQVAVAGVAALTSDKTFHTAAVAEQVLTLIILGRLCITQAVAEVGVKLVVVAVAVQAVAEVVV